MDPQSSEVNQEIGEHPRTSIKIIKQEAFFALPIFGTPRYRVEHLLRWQYQLLRMIENNSELHLLPLRDKKESEHQPGDSSVQVPEQYIREVYHQRIVNVVLDFNSHAGKLCFMKAIKHNLPDRCIAVHGLPHPQGLIDIIREARDDGWEEDIVIINARYQEDTLFLDNVINNIALIISTTECRNLWIFTNVVPCLTEIAPEYWKFYKIWADWPNRILSHLNPMSLEEATIERQRQEKYISVHGALPRRQT